MATTELSFSVPSMKMPDSNYDDGSLERHQSAQLLADALKRMDGIIGDYRPPTEVMDISSIDDPILVAIIDHCNQLSGLMNSWDKQNQEVELHPNTFVQVEVKEKIVNWLCGKQLGTPQQLEQLQKDKSELLKQVVTHQQQLAVENKDREKLTNKVADLERRVIERNQQIHSLGEELRVTKTNLQSKEVELRHLHDELQAGYRANSHTNKSQKSKKVTIQSSAGEDNPLSRTSSFREVLAKKFKRKKARTVSLEQFQEPLALKPVNPGAAKFYSMNSEGVCAWLTSNGIDMYNDLFEQNLITGDILAGMVVKQGNSELVRFGIVSTLHCKKLHLAVEDALSETPSRLSVLDYKWVGEWLCDIGLPQYQRTFMDARVDGRMLNVITMDDLVLLDVTTPFHITSMKRAVQALRICAYDSDYLKDSCLQRNKGSQKLLHWSVKDVVQWVRNIELDDYIGGLSNTGIHGAVMLLDVRFTSESLASVLGISASKSLIRTHLSRKFMELIGPVGSQKKIDAMQSKAFVSLDPMEKSKGFTRSRSRSMGSRRGRSDNNPEVQLCPFEECPESLFSATCDSMQRPSSLQSMQSQASSTFTPETTPLHMTTSVQYVTDSTL